MLKKTIHRTSQKLQNMDQTLNGPDPRFVSYRENGKDISVEKADINADHAHSYIGKMRTDGEGTYSDEVITALLSYFITHTKKDEKIVIELANQVSELLNETPDKEEYTTVDEQKKHIIAMTKKINKKRINDVEIIDIEENNKELFTVMKSQGISGLDNNGTKPEIPEDHFTSLDIAKYLYRICQNDPLYFQAIKDLKPNELKEKTGDSDYYGMIELAIRINALLHGITLQGGVGRQKKYDALLLKHINTHISEYPLLDNLKIFCEKKLEGKSFGGLYFDTEKSEQLAEKIAQKNKIAFKWKMIVAITAGAIAGALGTVEIGDYLQSKKIEKQQQETIKEIFENKRVFRSGDMASGEYEGQEKIERINKYIQQIYERFLFRYGSLGKFSKDTSQFKSKIVDCLNNQDVLNIMGNYNDNICLEDKVIDDYLIPNNIGEFKTADVPTTPYEIYKPYTEAFINTILLDKDFESTWDSTYKTRSGYRGMNAVSHDVEDIGEYSLKDAGWYGNGDQRYRLAINTSGKKYILATRVYYGKFDKEKNNELYTQYAKELAIDFLKQNKPVINKVLDQYLIRFYKNNDRSYGEDHLPRQIENFLIKDFLYQGMLEKIEKNQIDKIIAYLDEFVITNKDTLQKLTGDVNSNLIPNGVFQEYEEAMQNTIQDYDTIFKNHSWLPSDDITKEGLAVKYIGKYAYSDGKTTYDIGYVILDGKKYLYAYNSKERIYARQKNSFGVYYGNLVALDYFKTKSAFLQKKILLEKKLKSASQKHQERPLKNDSLPTFSDYVKNNPKGMGSR